MKKFFKPEVKFVMNDELAEGIYMSSGGISASAHVSIHQRPETGRWDFRCQANVDQFSIDKADDYYVHLIVTFSHPVNVLGTGSGFQIVSDGPGSYTVELCMKRRINNSGENIGFGDLQVMTENNLAEDLQVESASAYLHLDPH